MITCQNCGQGNTDTSNFCRFCGTKFIAPQQVEGIGYEYAPPRPYMWKTDEFQVGDSRGPKRTRIEQVTPIPSFNTMPNQALQPQTFQAGGQMQYAAGYHCPRCRSQLYPRVVKKISAAGWIVFAVLLVTFFPLFWVGFLIKEETRICPVCNLRIS